MVIILLVFFFKQKTAYEMRISDWSSDVCSSDLGKAQQHGGQYRVVAGSSTVAGTAGLAVVDAEPGGVGSTSGPLLPQPASRAMTRQSGNSKRDRKSVV